MWTARWDRPRIMSTHPARLASCWSAQVSESISKAASPTITPSAHTLPPNLREESAAHGRQDVRCPRTHVTQIVTWRPAPENAGGTPALQIPFDADESFAQNSQWVEVGKFFRIPVPARSDIPGGVLDKRRTDLQSRQSAALLLRQGHRS